MDVFRDWPSNLAFVVFWLVGPGIVGAVLLVVAGFDWTLFLAVPLLGATAVGVRRSLRAAVLVGHDGLMVRRVWSTRFIPSEDVVGLDSRHSWSLRRDCLVIRLRCGEEVGVASIPADPRLLSWPGAEDAGLDELEERMRKVFARRAGLP